jgi:DNA-binding response OmpR family regulator
MRLLFVEDARSSASPIGSILSHAGYAVDFVDTKREAEEAAQLVCYSLAILDRGVSDGDALSLLRSLRQSGSTIPVILLTSLRSTEALIQGLDAGADDYLVKPLDTRELLARVRALLRRPRDELHLKLEGGNVSFDTTSREVKIDSRPLILSRREVALLEALLRRAGRVVTRETLEETLFESHKAFTPNAIEATVSRLRRRLTSSGATLDIHTVRGIGYCAEPMPPSPAQPLKPVTERSKS